MISILSSRFTLSLYSPTDARVLEDMYTCVLEFAGPTDDLGQLTTRNGAIDHRMVELLWEEHVLLRVPSSRCPEGRAIAPDLLAAFLPATRSMFALAVWIGQTLGAHDWLEGPPIELFGDRVRTTLLACLTVGRVTRSGLLSTVREKTTIQVDDLAAKRHIDRRPWISLVGFGKE